VNLYLVGYRCVGKTAVGRLLSVALAWAFVDMDEVLEAETGTTIQKLVASRGWPYFREREASLLERLSGESKLVVATGGGAVTRPLNITLMRRSGKVVWLEASPASIAARMLADVKSPEQRPALRGESALVEIEETLRERLPLYEEAMHFRINTDRRSTEEVAREVLGFLGQAGVVVGAGR
jgi:shikimate kinase